MTDEPSNTATKKQKAQEILQRIATKFPDTPMISSEEICEAMGAGFNPSGTAGANDKPVTLYLVDVRDPEERDVSMIPGAITLAEFDSVAEKSTIDPDALIIPYCTMGYRSGVCATKLMQKGYTNVKNGEGIVMWCHSGKELVRRKPPTNNRTTLNSPQAEAGAATAGSWVEEPVQEVHTFGSRWDLVPDRCRSVQYSTWGMLYSVVRSMLWGS